MQKKTWLIVGIAALCAVVLGVTVWFVWAGVQSVAPQEVPQQSSQEESLPQEEPPAVFSEDEVAPIDPQTGIPEGQDNIFEDQWGDVEESSGDEEVPQQQEEISEEPAEEESIVSDYDLAVSDEGWTNIY